MVSVALNISDDFKAMIDKLHWVNWSEVAREEALKRLKLAEDFETFKRIVSKSKLTEKDALELGRKINKSLHKRYEGMFKGE